jgi:hypothetical protein
MNALSALSTDEQKQLLILLQKVTASFENKSETAGVAAAAGTVQADTRKERAGENLL